MDVLGSVRLEGSGNGLIFPDGSELTSASAGLVLPYSGSVSTSPPTYWAFSVTNTSYDAILGVGSLTGILGETSGAYSGTAGVQGQIQSGGAFGALGYDYNAANSTTFGVYGAAVGSNSYAGYFSGNVFVTGEFDVGGAKHFKIDHPLDPANKYLVHSSVESNEMLNIYKGHVTTDANGDATISLPEYFEALNKDIEYHLTVVGQFAQAMISQEVADNRFAIKTDKPNVKVSWQVLGARQDAYAKTHPMQVEQDKPDYERGKYINPKDFGLSADKGIVSIEPQESTRRNR